MQFEKAIAIPDQDKTTRPGIYASDAASILGFAPESWQSAMDIYLRNVTGKAAHEPDQELMDYGRTIEPFVLRSLSRRLGKQVLHNSVTYVSKEHPWLGATPDGFVPDDQAGVEAKAITFTRGEWGEPESGQIPLHYACQAAVGMIVTGLPRWYVPAAFGAKTELFIVERDEPLLAGILSKLDAFRQQHIVTKTPPPVFTSRDARILWPKDSGKSLVATEEIQHLLLQLDHARVAAGQATEIFEGLKTQVQVAMGEHSAIETPDGRQLVTWRKARDGEMVDSEKLRTEYPDIFDKVKKPRIGARRFLIKD